MKFDPQAEQNMQRLAMEVLTAPHTEIVAGPQEVADKVPNSTGAICKEGETVRIPNEYYVDPINVTCPATLTQELAWANTNNTLQFDFSLDGPVFVAGVNNNIPLGKNNVAAIYGIQLRFGEGTNSANRIYRSFGNTPNDNALYNSIISVKVENSVLIDKVDGQDFLEVPDIITAVSKDSGLTLINPLRVVTGELGFFSVFINMRNPISTLVMSANMFVSMRLKLGFGSAKG